MAFLALLRISCPLLGQGQAEVEQGMIVATDVSHVHPDLAVVDLASMTTPLPLHPHRVRAAFGETAGIEGDNAIGFAQPIGHLSDSHGHQGPMIPWHRADEVLDDLSLDIDEGGDLLRILTLQMGQQPLEVEVHMAPAGLGLQSVVVG